MTCLAHAKVNLTLEVFDKRSDGYHALRSVVLPISLADTLTVEPAGELSTDSPYAGDLALRAAEALRRAAGDETLGAAIHTVKRIPSGAGLGGGSADAAATLRALNSIWGLGFDLAHLAEIGTTVGSDVAALVFGGIVVMEGRGEIVTPLRGLNAGAIHLVLAKPPVFSSTKEVYANVTTQLPNGGQILYNMRQALTSGNLDEIAAATMNDLQAPAIGLHPEIAGAMDALRGFGAKGVVMSGSGSTVFGLVPTESRGREIAAALTAKGLWAQAAEAVDCPVV